MIYYLKAGATDNELGLPTEWPVKMQKAKEGEELEAPWLLATEDEYEAHRAQYQQEYDAWRANRKRQDEEMKKVWEEQIKSPCLALKKKLEGLSFTEEEMKMLMGKHYVEG